MPNLRPFRDYDEKDVINFYSFSGTVPTNRGTLVKIVTGFQSSDEPIQMLGSPGASYRNTVSQRYGTTAQVAATSAGDSCVGILLKDVREYDENGELLRFNPVKAAEMDVAISGEAVPIAAKGSFLYSGVVLSSQTPVPHTRLYAGPTGEITTGVSGNSIGYCLGSKDTNGCVLIRLNIV